MSTLDRWLITGARVIDPASGLDGVFDVLVEGEVIAEIKPASKVETGRRGVSGLESLKREGRVVDARGKILCPGLIDMHVHLREPGREDEETVESGAKAAVRGGFTSIACMPNTEPPADSASVIELVLRRAAEAGLCNVFPVGAISKGLAGERLAEMGDLVRAGAVAFSDDGNCVMDSGLMRRAMEYTRIWDRTIISHAEDAGLAAGGQMNEGLRSTLLGLAGIPAEAEEAIIARDLILAGLTGARLHVAHVSTVGSVDLIRRAKQRGVRVTCEVTPHHLLLTDEALCGYDANFKVKPPLRRPADVEALRAGLADGTIDVVASDHAPHALQEKECEFTEAPFGVVGLETTLGLVLTELVGKGVLSLPDAIAGMSLSPARVLGIPRGKLAVGETADLTLIDPQAEYVVDPGAFQSRSRNTPFAGWRLKGRASAVFVGGRLVFSAPEEAMPATEPKQVPKDKVSSKSRR